MKNHYLLLILLLFSSCSSKMSSEYLTHHALPELTIIEIHPNKWTAMTKQNLTHLYQVYDLTPITFQKKIYIHAKPQSFWKPHLTFSTNYAEKPYTLLAELIYFQMQWFLEVRSTLLKKTKLSQELVARFLEWKSLEFYLGKLKAKEVFMNSRQKSKNNEFILKREKEILKQLKRHQLIPPSLENLIL